MNKLTLIRHKIILIFGLTLLVLSSGLTRLHADPVIPTDQSQFHLYLLIGQSNMCGAASIQEQDKWTDPHILSLDLTDQWVVASNPLHPDQSGGVGPGMDFARKMLEANPGITIGLIPCAINGSPIESWWANAANFERAISRYESVKTQGILKGILMHQGEANSIPKPSTNASYSRTLTGRVIPAFRSAVGNPFVPFIVGQIGQFLSTESYPSGSWVNQQISELPTKVIFTSVVSSDGLDHGGDFLHFNTASERELGIRYAAALQTVQGRFHGFRTNATEVLPDIFYHPSFGYYYDQYDPWVYHFAIGWIYFAGNSGDFIWFWSPTLGWMTTTLEYGPLVYVYEGNSWICICGDDE